MVIHSVNLKNFGPIKNANLEFTSGINLILGDNYQGKSHILKAIAFMLINYKEKRIEDYCNWNSDNFITNMKFTYGGEFFNITYNYNEGGNLNRKLIIDKDEIFTGSDCTSKLVEYFDPPSCRASILSMQGEINLVSVKPAQRRENLKKIYDLEFNNQIIELKSRISEIEDNELNKIKKRMIILENKDYDLKEYEELPCTEEVYVNALMDEDEYKNKVNNIKKEQEDFDKNKKEICRLKTEIKNEDKKIIQFDEELSNLKNKKVEFENKLGENFLEKKDKLLKKLNDTDWEKQLNEFNINKNSIKFIRPINFNRIELKNLQKELNEELNPKLTIANNKLKSSWNNICSECGKPYSDEDRKTIILEHKKLSNEYDILNENIKKLLIKKKRYEEIEEKNRKSDNEISKLNIRIEEEEKRIEVEKSNLIKEIESESKQVDEKKNNLLFQIENLDSSINILKNQIKDKQELIETYRKQIKNINLPDLRPILSDELLLQLNEIIFITKAYESIIEKNKIFKEHNDEILQDKEKDKIELEKLKKEKNKLDMKILKLKDGISILNKSFPNFVIESTIKDIENGMNIFLSNTNYEKNKVSIEKVKDGIGVFYGKGKRDISIASGYEKQLFNIAYKNSFAQMAGLRILFLDEIDSYASEENSKILFKTIAKLSDDYEQIFIITHKTHVQDILIQDYNATAFIVDKGEIRLY